MTTTYIEEAVEFDKDKCSEWIKKFEEIEARKKRARKSLTFITFTGKRMLPIITAST